MLAAGRIRGIKRSRVFSVSDPANLVAWWDFADASTIWEDAAGTNAAEVNDIILNVTDKAGSFDLTSVANGPTWITSDRGRFDGTNDELQNTSNIVSQPDTIFIAGKKNDTTNIEHFIDGPTNRQVIGVVANKFALYAGTVLDSGVAVDTTARIFCGIFNGASSKLYLSGGTPASGAGGSDSLASGIKVANDTGAGGAFASIDVYEILIYSGALSAADLNLVGNYLEAKWGLTWTDVS